MIRKLPHVGLSLPDMAERSMPEQDGLTWRVFGSWPSGTTHVQILEDLFGRDPIRVVAEVGEAIPEIEGS